MRDDAIGDGFDVFDQAGALIGAVVPHPRIEGMWMAMWKPTNHRDSGMKKYKTRRGAIRRVERAADDRHTP